MLHTLASAIAMTAFVAAVMAALAVIA